MADTFAPDTPSSDYQAMRPYWEMVERIVAGADAIREAGPLYLPQFPEESAGDYDHRRRTAKFTNIYADIVDNLASKPFAEEVTLDDGADAMFLALAEDIDGRGNNLHVFAAETFHGGVNNAVDWVVVDFTKARQRGDGQPLSLAEEQAQGLRPYWVRVPARDMLAVYSDVIQGKEVYVHARWREFLVRRDGFSEVSIERVRVMTREPVFLSLDDGTVTDQVVGYGPPTSEVWEQNTEEEIKKGAEGWRKVEEAALTIDEIPIRPFITGRRLGASWRFVAPLKGVAFLQIEHYQAETALKSIKELTAFPMLAGNGVTPQMENGKAQKVPVGPRTVLYAPPIMGDSSASHGEWKFIEPAAASLKFLAEEVATIEQQMRELGRQPLTATAGITVVTAALASQKASTAVQAWALALKNTLEECLKLTAKWLGLADGPQVKVFTDFALETNDTAGPEWLRDMAKRNRLSRDSEWEEAQRRGILSGDFDPAAEATRLEAESAARQAEAQAVAAAAAAVKPAPVDPAQAGA